MYNRSYGQRRPPRIPQNYAGNAFGPQGSVPLPQPHIPEDPPKESPADPSSAGSSEPQGSIFALPAPPMQAPDEAFRTEEDPLREKVESQKPAPHPLLQKSLGDEELLILALILLLSQGGGSGDAGEVIPFLILLLFC